MSLLGEAFELKLVDRIDEAKDLFKSLLKQHEEGTSHVDPRLLKLIKEYVDD